jgi:hypothetical protein
MNIITTTLLPIISPKNTPTDPQNPKMPIILPFEIGKNGHKKRTLVTRIQNFTDRNQNHHQQDLRQNVS